MGSCPDTDIDPNFSSFHPTDNILLPLIIIVNMIRDC